METINPLIPNSDKHVISPHNITIWSGHENEDDLSWFLCKFSQILYHWKYMKNSEEN